MLVLSRKLGEKIVIGDNIVVTVVKIDRNQIRIGIEAPNDVLVYREEIAPHAWRAGRTAPSIALSRCLELAVDARRRNLDEMTTRKPVGACARFGRRPTSFRNDRAWSTVRPSPDRSLTLAEASRSSAAWMNLELLAAPRSRGCTGRRTPHLSTASPWRVHPDTPESSGLARISADADQGDRGRSPFERAGPARVRDHRRDVGYLDRNGGERPAWRPGPSGDVVGCRHRHASGPGQSARLARALGRRSPLGLLPAYWIENKGGNSFWHAPIRPRASASGCITGRSSIAATATTAQSTYQDTIVRPNLPDRTEASRCPALGSRGLGRQPADDGPGRCAGFDLRRLFSHGRPPFVGPAQGGRPAAEPLSLSRDRRRPGASAGGSTGSPSGPPGTRYQQYQGATNLLTTKLTWRYGPIQVLITDFVAMGDCLPAERRPGEIARPVHQAVLHQERGDRGSPGDLRGLRAGRDQRRRRRRRVELARHRQVAAGDQPRPRPLQPQAGARRDRSSSPWLLTTAAKSSASRPGPNEAILFRSLELPAGGRR